jgi:hypothetical protein
MPDCGRKKSRLLCGACSGSVAVFLLVSLHYSLGAFAQRASPQLSMDSVNVRQEGVVSFSTLALGPESRSDFPAPKLLFRFASPQ